MRITGFGRFALSTCVAAAMLAGCGGSQPPIGAPGAMQQSSPLATHTDRGGSWVLPFFTGSHDAEAAAAVALGMRLLWLAAGYQFFDGLNLGSSMCLRGAGDVRVPALLVLPVSLLLFAPLAHAFTFAPGQGWVHFLPQFGWGAVGGWVAVLIYVMVLGSTLFLRWRSCAWQKIRL